MSPFADIETREKSNFQKTVFLDTPPGQHLIRILDKNATKIHTHYVNKTSVLCLEDECPICLNNKRIIVENPDNFREIKGFSSRSKRYFVNVLDRTPVKTCPNCQTQNKKGPNGLYTPTCSSCGAFINQVQEAPSNKVKLFGFGVGVAEQLNAYEQTILDPQGNPIPFDQFDIILMVSGTGKDKKTIAVAMPQNHDAVEVPDDAKFDTAQGVVRLSAEEIVQLQKGISLKDIFTARKGEPQAEKAVAQLGEELGDELKKKISDMFAN